MDREITPFLEYDIYPIFTQSTWSADHVRYLNDSIHVKGFTNHPEIVAAGSLSVVLPIWKAFIDNVLLSPHIERTLSIHQDNRGHSVFVTIQYEYTQNASLTPVIGIEQCDNLSRENYEFMHPLTIVACHIDVPLNGSIQQKHIHNNIYTKSQANIANLSTSRSDTDRSVMAHLLSIFGNGIIPEFLGELQPSFGIQNGILFAGGAVFAYSHFFITSDPSTLIEIQPPTDPSQVRYNVIGIDFSLQIEGLLKCIPGASASPSLARPPAVPDKFFVLGTYLSRSSGPTNELDYTNSAQTLTAPAQSFGSYSSTLDVTIGSSYTILSSDVSPIIGFIGKGSLILDEFGTLALVTSVPSSASYVVRTLMVSTTSSLQDAIRAYMFYNIKDSFQSGTLKLTNSTSVIRRKHGFDIGYPINPASLKVDPSFLFGTPLNKLTLYFPKLSERTSFNDSLPFITWSIKAQLGQFYYELSILLIDAKISRIQLVINDVGFLIFDSQYRESFDVFGVRFDSYTRILSFTSVPFDYVLISGTAISSAYIKQLSQIFIENPEDVQPSVSHFDGDAFDQFGFAATELLFNVLAPPLYYGKSDVLNGFLMAPAVSDLQPYESDGKSIYGNFSIAKSFIGLLKGFFSIDFYTRFFQNTTPCHNLIELKFFQKATPQVYESLILNLDAVTECAYSQQDPNNPSDPPYSIPDPNNPSDPPYSISSTGVGTLYWYSSGSGYKSRSILSALNILFSPQEWHHVGIKYDHGFLSVNIDDFIGVDSLKVFFDAHDYDSCSFIINESRGTINLDELAFVLNNSDLFDTYQYRQQLKIPFGSLDYTESCLVIDAEEEQHIYSNIFKSPEMKSILAGKVSTPLFFDKESDLPPYIERVFDPAQDSSYQFAANSSVGTQFRAISSGQLGLIYWDEDDILEVLSDTSSPIEFQDLKKVVGKNIYRQGILIFVKDYDLHAPGRKAIVYFDGKGFTQFVI